MISKPCLAPVNFDLEFIVTCDASESHFGSCLSQISTDSIWPEWHRTVIAATVRIALVDILDLSEVDIPAGVFLHPAVGWG